jgi:hypothetical protein
MLLLATDKAIARFATLKAAGSGSDCVETHRVSNIPRHLSSSDLHRDQATASLATGEGSMFITSANGRDYLVLSSETYRLLNPRRSILDALADDGPEADFEFEPPRLDARLRATEIDFDL